LDEKTGVASYPGGPAPRSAAPIYECEVAATEENDAIG